MHQSRFILLSPSCYIFFLFEILILLFTFFQFYSLISRYSKVDNFSNSLFLLIIIRYGLLADTEWSVCVSKFNRSLCVSFSKTAAGLCIYHLFVWSNLNFLHISLWIIVPTQSYLVLYFFYANLLHSLIMWLMVSSLSPYNLHFLFCCVLSILALIWLVLMALLCAAIRRDSVSLLKFPFLAAFSAAQILKSLWSTSPYHVTLICPGLPWWWWWWGRNGVTVNHLKARPSSSFLGGWLGWKLALGGWVVLTQWFSDRGGRNRENGRTFW